MKEKITKLVIITAIAGLLYTNGTDLFMTCFALGYDVYKGFPQEVYLDIAFQDNVFLETYDVDVYIDDEKIDTIPHGQYYTDMRFDLRKGTHTISFYKKGDMSVSGNYAFNVKGETTFKCMIHARHSDILVDQVQVFRGGVAIVVSADGQGCITALRGHVHRPENEAVEGIPVSKDMVPECGLQVFRGAFADGRPFLENRTARFQSVAAVRGGSAGGQDGLRPGQGDGRSDERLAAVIFTAVVRV
jgi:hypothetical protein